MARTYWHKQADEAYEFLGAYQDGHKVKDKAAPQARAAGTSRFRL